jgi:FdhE protein
MSWSWPRRIDRANELLTRFPESAALLTFYGHLARFQKSIFDKLNVKPETDVEVLTTYFPEFVKCVKCYGPKDLAASAPTDIEKLLLDCWAGERLGSEPAKFYARALLQPFAEALAGRGTVDTQSTAPRCPFCSALPVAAILRGEGDGARRSLLCSLCATEWQYRRVVCPNCGEENKDQLPVYLAEGIDYVRVDACDACRTYIKSVDLTKNGHAVPVVDELATLTLTLWAEENGYSRIETNLLGM